MIVVVVVVIIAIITTTNKNNKTGRPQFFSRSDILVFGNS
jgi:hypothetical protein